MPATSSPALSASAIAAAAESGGSPNFEPWWAVRIEACVSTSIPGVTRRSTRRTPAATARSTSSAASSTTYATSAAARSSSSLLLLPCMTIRSAGTPARRAKASSPSVETSAPRPSSASREITATLGNALTLYATSASGAAAR